ncbi:uncharacterized protein LOC121861209 [Homarus americanus]|uniref:uncharacterized protein LOC121861209 n=1 Tax=Homarus americanus TaxID=6706 RepID=UPI001C48FF73|nr:uncharacterized protein LOC121861209 [Homarus americanus]
MTSGYKRVLPRASLRLDHFNTGSVPDLGPHTIDRIAGVNQYLQQRWTNYFGELSVPLGGRAGWPAQVIGESTLLVNEKTSPAFMKSINTPSPGPRTSLVLNGGMLKSESHKDDLNITRKLDDLRAWLDTAAVMTDQ